MAPMVFRLLPIVSVLALPLAASAQSSNARYELAWRTSAFERAWMATTAEQHAAVLPTVEAAVQRFFSMDFAGVASALDEARLSLEQRSGPLDLERFAVQPQLRLVDAASTSLALTISPLYESESAAPFALRASFQGKSLAIEPASIEVPAKGADRGVRLSLDGVAALGDITIEVELSREGGARAVREVRLSRAESVESRIAALKTALNALPESAPTLERETVRTNVELLEKLSKSSNEETDFPAAALLADSERMVERAAKAERWFGIERSGESWMTVPSGKNGARVRLFVPEGLSEERKVPLVVALHGAGGSENMFFDAYGDGLIVELCRKRGWMLVAPRVGFMGTPVSAVLGALRERYPVDSERVLVIGHSMGAGVGQQLVAKDPGAYRAFAALGGGSGLKDASALAAEPIFVGAGERDFGRRGAEALHKSLAAAGSTVAQLRIYPNCEHLMIVVDALPDVFASWDALLAAK